MMQATKYTSKETKSVLSYTFHRTTKGKMVKWLSLSRNNKTIQNFLEVSVYLRVLVTSREKPFFKFLVTSYETHT